MQQIGQDLRYGFRSLAGSPGFTTVVMLTLAVGISAATAIFSLLNAFLLRPLAFPNPDELVHIWQSDRRLGENELRVSVPNYFDWRRQSTTFQDLGGYFYQSVNLSAEDEPVRIQVGRMTPNLIHLLGVRPILGRTFLEEEAEPGKDRVVLLSHSFWERRFGSDRNVLGKTVRLDGELYGVVGVMPSDFVFPLKATQMWAPLSLDPWKDRREMNGPLLVVGRLERGCSIEQAQAEMKTIMQRLESQYPEDNTGKGALVVPLRKALLFFHDMIRVTFTTLFAAVVLVLLMVCANVGNLLLARATARYREIAIRAALGGGRGRLIRQLLTESLLLACLGGALGSVAAFWLVRLLAPSIPEDLYRVGEIEVDAVALAFTVVVSFVSALLFGLAPALQTTRPNLTEALKEGSRGTSGMGSGRLRSALVVCQIILAAVLLAGSVLMIQSFYRLQSVEAGFDPDNVLTLETDLPESEYRGDAEENIFYQSVLERVRALPSVASAATVYPLPLNFESMSQSFTIEGQEADPGEELSANNFWVSTDYFRTMGIPLLKGRVFSESDTEQASAVAIINQRMAERFWPNEDPVGKRVRLDPKTEDERWATIVGIVGNSKHFLLSEDTATLIYLPQLQESTARRFLAVRTEGDPLALVDQVRRAIWAEDPNLPITTIRSMSQVLAESLGPWTGGTATIALLGLGALLLSALGIYGVISFSLGQRVHEMGIRMALGARSGNILWLIVTQGLRLTAIGAAIGLAAAAGLTQLMRSILFGVGRLDPLTFIGTPLLLVTVALAASFVPALRAARADPIHALRHE